MLSIRNLGVSIDSLPILKDLELSVEPGSTHVLMGPNGSGKSTLAYALIGHPAYAITGGSMDFNQILLNDLSPDKRARLGIFLAFQHPLEIPGVRVSNFLKEAYQAMTGAQVSVSDFNKLLLETMDLLSIDPAFAHRNVNEGFSGGEKKCLELLQLILLRPKLAILDEIDSGLDLDALKKVAYAIALIREKNPLLSLIIITHNPRILDYIQPDHVHILKAGSIIRSGDAQLVRELEDRGYDAFV